MWVYEWDDPESSIIKGTVISRCRTFQWKEEESGSGEGDPKRSFPWSEDRLFDLPQEERSI